MDFTDYVLKHKDRLLEIREFLINKISDNPSAMEDDLRTANQHYATLNEIAPYSECFLSSAESIAYDKLDGNATEKRMKMAGRCLDEKRFCAVIDGRIKAIEKRIKSAITLISSAKAERAGNR